MPNFRLGRRAGWASVAALACVSATACDSVLDIEDPQMRPADAGEPSSGATAGKASSSAGVPSTSPEGGAGGEAGRGGAAGAEPVVAGAGSGGEGGELTVTQQDCETGSVRCADKAPEVCDASGHWAPNEAEAEGDCAVQCQEGRCVACLADEKRCTVCEAGDDACNANQPQRCVDGAWASDGASCGGYCDAGDCKMPQSCPTFGAEQVKCGTESCCKSKLVPGGTFKRGFDEVDYSDPNFPATVSPFLLDKFEVNVGRFRRFVTAFDEVAPSLGDGKSPHIVGDKGWTANLELPEDRAALIAELNCGPAATWSDDDTENNSLPINCVRFAVAYAFCIWDGGRLPTEAEWNFAASGGEQQRAYPWPPPEGEDPITPAYASWDGADPGPLPVGSKPLGDARWGQADMASNVREWVLDYYREEYPMPCVDCVHSTAEIDRVLRGGAWSLPQDALLSAGRSSLEPGEIRPTTGFRCARDATKIEDGI